MGFSHSDLTSTRKALASSKKSKSLLLIFPAQWKEGPGLLRGRLCDRGGKLLRAVAAALMPGALVYFIFGFTSIMRRHLLTTSLSSINPVPLEAEPRSCWASQTLACSLLLPWGSGKWGEGSYRWNLFAMRVCLGADKATAGVPARKHTSWWCIYICSPSSNSNEEPVRELMC